MSDYSKINNDFDDHCRAQGIPTYLELVQMVKDAEPVTVLPQPDNNGYTPSTKVVREAFVEFLVSDERRDEYKDEAAAGSAFDRWLVSALAAARKEALDEALTKAVPTTSEAGIRGRSVPDVELVWLKSLPVSETEKSKQ